MHHNGKLEFIVLLGGCGVPKIRCHCEPVRTLVWQSPMAAQRSVFGAYLTFFNKKLAYFTNQGFPKIHEIATPVCALARNDISFERTIN